MVESVLGKLRANVLPDEAERQHVDCKEEAGRRGAGGVLLPGTPRNLAAADHLASEVACMANTPGGGALIVGVEDASGRFLGAALEEDWLRHRIYERVGIAPAVEAIAVDGMRLLVVYVAEAREPVEDLAGRTRWRAGGHCEPVDRAEWWLHRQNVTGHDPMAAITDHTYLEVAPGAVATAQRYLASSGSPGDQARYGSVQALLSALGVLRPDGKLTQAGALTFCPADRTYLSLSVLDVEGGDVISSPPDLAGLSLLEQVAAVDERLDALNTSIRLEGRPGFALSSVRRLPEGAVREAVLNGVVHRDWMQPDPVAITWIEADSAVQVVSPGGFVGGMNAGNVLTQRYARYPALADLFRALHLVEKQGLGVDRMYRDMVSLGHRPPVLVEEEGPRVRVRLSGGRPVLPVMNLVMRIQPSIRQRDVRVALIVYTLLREPFVTAERLTEVLQRSAEEAAEGLEAAAECLVGEEPLLAHYKDVWTLSAQAVSAVETVADRDELKRRGVLLYIKPDITIAESAARKWLSDHDRYTSGDHAWLTGLTTTGARGQLERLERDGVLVRGEGAGRNSHFVAGPSLK
ncbi:DUF5635 domain-containing protein [Streptomyces sp. IBSBF 2435]|uniref:DUF5635 domain-containing protein n=1 Tax=Streptomyces sp. IBSBF 2435 TaxID=2903531 RepID=UPI002FDBC628